MATSKINFDNRNSNEYFVSIIIPCYLREIEYVSQLINQLSSVEERDVETIFVIDGYADEKLLEDFIKKVSEIKNCVVAVHEQNQGVSEARNTGISFAKGIYSLFVDADDLVDTSVLSKAIEVLKQNKDIEILCMRMKDFNDSQSPSYLNDKDIKNIVLADSKSVYDDYLYFDEKLNDYMFRSSCGKLIKTKIISDNGISFLKGLKHFEDALFLKQCINKAERIYLLENGDFYFYRANMASASRSYSSDLEEQFGMYYNNCKELQIASKSLHLDSAYLFLIDLAKNKFLQNGKITYKDIKNIFDIKYIKESLLELRKIDLSQCKNKLLIRMKKIIVFKTLLFTKIYFYNFAKKYIVKQNEN